MRIIVTGGAGFIGSHLIKYLLANTQAKILNIDKLTYAGNLSTLRSLEKNPNHFFIKLDICKHDKIKAIFDKFKPQLIFNLAAETNLDKSVSNSDKFIHTNINGTYSLAKISLDYWKKLSIHEQHIFRFIQISSGEVFGTLRFNDKPFNEKSPPKPYSPYGASKASADLILKSFYKTYKFPVIITHSVNNYGPYQHPEKFIPLCILNALEEKPLPIYGNGKQIRDWIHVNDHCEALLKIAKLGKIGESYCISANCEKTNLDLIKYICHALDRLAPRKSKRSYLKLIKFVQEHPGHAVRFAASNEKLTQQLKWKPKVRFLKGMLQTVNWYLNNKMWIKQVQEKQFSKIRKTLAKAKPM